MKNLTLTSVFIALSLFTFSQPTVNIWRITPDSVCPGDSIKIDYKTNGWPNSPDQTVNTINMIQPYVNLWSGNWSILKARPKERWAALPAGDSAYWIKVRIPLGTSVGAHTVFTGNNQNYPPIYIKDCSCTITANYTYTLNYGVAKFTSSTVGENSSTTYLWDFGDGAGWQAAGSSVSYTYTSNGQRTVKMTANNPLCTDNISKTINVKLLDVGIEENSLPEQTPIYFDLYGNRVEKRPNEILIEQVGGRRKKILESKD